MIWWAVLVVQVVTFLALGCYYLSTVVQAIIYSSGLS